jgi:hypothetical protein
MVATSEHIVLRRGPDVVGQRFEAGEEVNAALAEKTDTIMHKIIGHIKSISYLGEIKNMTAWRK